MLKAAVLGFGLLVPGMAFACGGNADCGSCAHHADAADADKTTAAVGDPAACAKKAELVGGACSYTTGMMAQRVLSEGKNWAYTGTIAAVDSKLASHVAAPFAVGPDQVYVVANEVLESLTGANAQAGRVSLEGKLLEVDGTKYYVLTGFAALNS